MRPSWRPWREAWQDALYGEAGFYRSADGPAGHFETSANAPGGGVDLLAGALGRLADRHGCDRVVDIGAGRGELLSALAGQRPDLALTGVDVVDRPATLTPRVSWLRSPGGLALPPELGRLAGAEASGRPGRSLVLAHEWLDVVPCDVLEVDDGGDARVVEVAGDGRERLGDVASVEQLDWCARWWPVRGRPAGTRVEVGQPRDQAWRDLLALARPAVAVAVDYGHLQVDRPPSGTLAGHRDGHLVPPRPDGSTDITADVAWDSVLASSPAVEGTSDREPAPVLTTQREMLLDLGVDPSRPPLELAQTHGGSAYAAALARACAAATLLDRDGLGGLGWLVHARVEG